VCDHRDDDDAFYLFLKPVCGGGVCLGGVCRFHYTYIYNRKRESCEEAKLVCVLVAETIHPVCMREGGGRVREGGGGDI
jgi:hypothetical protein